MTARERLRKVESFLIEVMGWLFWGLMIGAAWNGDTDVATLLGVLILLVRPRGEK